MTMNRNLPKEPADEARCFRNLPPWTFSTCHFKVHLLSYDRSRPPLADKPEVVAAARDYAASLIPDMDIEGNHFGLGYVILHEGENARNYWLLFDWWIAGGIRCRILSRAGGENPTRFERVKRPYSACVWEAVAVAHERNAWVRQC